MFLIEKRKGFFCAYKIRLSKRPMSKEPHGYLLTFDSWYMRAKSPVISSPERSS